MSVYGLNNDFGMRYDLTAQMLNGYTEKNEEESKDLEQLLEKTYRLVKNYNAVLDDVKEVSTLSMKREAQRLVEDTKKNAGSFAKIGISITNSGVLQMAEKKEEAKKEALKVSAYNKLGEYNKNYNNAYNSLVEVYIQSTQDFQILTQNV